MPLDIFLAIIVLVSLVLASIHDIKTHEVPDWLNFSLIAIGLSSRLIYSIITTEYSYFIYGIIGALSMFLLGTLLYQTKQWGGGDAKLLIALGAIFATNPEFVPSSPIPFLVTLVINILLIGAVYGSLFSIYLIIRNRNKFYHEIKILLKQNNVIFVQKLILTLSLFIILISLFNQDRDTKFILISLLVFIIIYTYFWIIIKAVENACMHASISPNKLVEGDWLADDVIINKKIIYSKYSPTLDKKDIEKLKKLNIKSVSIKQGIPFVPSFLFGTIITLLGFNIFNILL